jgi:uncharacterized membrane protein YsdA (DUF1294 family)
MRSPFIFFTLIFFLFVTALFVAIKLSLSIDYGSAFFASINCASLLMMAIDKRQAQTKAMRLPELLLFVMAAIGGTLAILLGSAVFRHKIRKASFLLTIICIGTFQTLLYHATR